METVYFDNFAHIYHSCSEIEHLNSTYTHSSELSRVPHIPPEKVLVEIGRIAVE